MTDNTPLPFRRCLQKVLVPTGGGRPLDHKLLDVVAHLDAVPLSKVSVPGSRFCLVLLAGNDRDLALAVERVVKLGGSIEASPPPS